MRSGDENLEENLETIQKVIEDAAGKVANSTKHKKILENEHPRKWNFVKKPPQGAQKWSKEEYSKNKRWKPERNTWLSAV